MKQERLRVQSRLPMPRLKRIPITAILTSGAAVCRATDEEVQRLAESVRRHGLIQPLGVKKRAGLPARYELLFGYRRLLACRALFLRSVPCLVFPEQSEAALLSLSENFQRRVPASAELVRAARRLNLSLPALCGQLPLPCPKGEKSPPLRDISVFLGVENQAEPAPAAPAASAFCADSPAHSAFCAPSASVFCGEAAASPAPSVCADSPARATLSACCGSPAFDGACDKTSAASGASRPAAKRRGIVRDARLIANSIERAVCAGRDAGVSVEVQKIQRECEILYHIRLPLSAETTVVFSDNTSLAA